VEKYENPFSFPPDFLWGAATSSHQVEGNNIHNDWWEWETTGRLKEPSGMACDHWNRFREDFQLAKSLSHNAHRFSIEWSRVEPEEGCFDEKAISHYKEVIASLRSNRLLPIVTLYHFTLPLWLAKQGGWLCPRAPRLFARFAERMAKELGQEVDTWVTLNEPEVYVCKSYLMGDWPPGIKSYKKCVQAMFRLLKAHTLAYHAIKNTLGRGPSTRIGIAKGVVVFIPCRARSATDKVVIQIRDFFFNHFFVKAAIRSLDFIGLNYYSRNFIRSGRFGLPAIFGDICDPAHHPEAGNKNSLGWEIWPEGIYQIVKAFSRYKRPILITENGICTNHDEERLQFIEEHLRALKKAMDEEAPVIGYLYWSLLDNFEWAEGFSPRFGLIEVDYKTQERKIRPSALRFAQICKSGFISLSSSTAL